MQNFQQVQNSNCRAGSPAESARNDRETQRATEGVRRSSHIPQSLQHMNTGGLNDEVFQKNVTPGQFLSHLKWHAVGGIPKQSGTPAQFSRVPSVHPRQVELPTRQGTSLSVGGATSGPAGGLQGAPYQMMYSGDMSRFGATPNPYGWAQLGARLQDSRAGEGMQSPHLPAQNRAMFGNSMVNPNLRPGAYISADQKTVRKSLGDPLLLRPYPQRSLSLDPQCPAKQHAPIGNMYNNIDTGGVISESQQQMGAPLATNENPLSSQGPAVSLGPKMETYAQKKNDMSDFSRQISTPAATGREPQRLTTRTGELVNTKHRNGSLNTSPYVRHQSVPTRARELVKETGGRTTPTSSSPRRTYRSSKSFQHIQSKVSHNWNKPKEENSQDRIGDRIGTHHREETRQEEDASFSRCATNHSAKSVWNTRSPSEWPPEARTDVRPSSSPSAQVGLNIVSTDMRQDKSTREMTQATGTNITRECTIHQSESPRPDLDDRTERTIIATRQNHMERQNTSCSQSDGKEARNFSTRSTLQKNRTTQNLAKSTKNSAPYKLPIVTPKYLRDIPSRYNTSTALKSRSNSMPKNDTNTQDRPPLRSYSTFGGRPSGMSNQSASRTSHRVKSQIDKGRESADKSRIHSLPGEQIDGRLAYEESDNVPKNPAKPKTQRPDSHSRSHQNAGTLNRSTRSDPRRPLSSSTMWRGSSQNDNSASGTDNKNSSRSFNRNGRSVTSRTTSKNYANISSERISNRNNHRGNGELNTDSGKSRQPMSRSSRTNSKQAHQNCRPAEFGGRAITAESTNSIDKGFEDNSEDLSASEEEIKEYSGRIQRRAERERNSKPGKQSDGSSALRKYNSLTNERTSRRASDHEVLRRSTSSKLLQRKSTPPNTRGNSVPAREDGEDPNSMDSLYRLKKEIAQEVLELLRAGRVEGFALNPEEDSGKRLTSHDHQPNEDEDTGVDEADQPDHRVDDHTGSQRDMRNRRDGRNDAKNVRDEGQDEMDARSDVRDSQFCSRENVMNDAAPPAPFGNTEDSLRRSPTPGGERLTTNDGYRGGRMSRKAEIFYNGDDYNEHEGLHSLRGKNTTHQFALEIAHEILSVMEKTDKSHSHYLRAISDDKPDRADSRPSPSSGEYSRVTFERSHTAPIGHSRGVSSTSQNMEEQRDEGKHHQLSSQRSDCENIGHSQHAVEPKTSSMKKTCDAVDLVRVETRHGIDGSSEEDNSGEEFEPRKLTSSSYEFDADLRKTAKKEDTDRGVIPILKSSSEETRTTCAHEDTAPWKRFDYTTDKWSGLDSNLEVKLSAGEDKRHQLSYSHSYSDNIGRGLSRQTSGVQTDRIREKTPELVRPLLSPTPTPPTCLSTEFTHLGGNRATGELRRSTTSVPHADHSSLGSKCQTNEFNLHFPRTTSASYTPEPLPSYQATDAPKVAVKSQDSSGTLSTQASMDFVMDFDRISNEIQDPAERKRLYGLLLENLSTTPASELTPPTKEVGGTTLMGDRAMHGRTALFLLKDKSSWERLAPPVPAIGTHVAFSAQENPSTFGYLKQKSDPHPFGKDYSRPREKNLSFSMDFDNCEVPVRTHQSSIKKQRTNNFGADRNNSVFGAEDWLRVQNAKPPKTASDTPKRTLDCTDSKNDWSFLASHPTDTSSANLLERTTTNAEAVSSSIGEAFGSSRRLGETATGSSPKITERKRFTIDEHFRFSGKKDLMGSGNVLTDDDTISELENHSSTKVKPHVRRVEYEETAGSENSESHSHLDHGQGNCSSSEEGGSFDSLPILSKPNEEPFEEEVSGAGSAPDIEETKTVRVVGDKLEVRTLRDTSIEQTEHVVRKKSLITNKYYHFAEDALSTVDQDTAAKKKLPRKDYLEKTGDAKLNDEKLYSEETSASPTPNKSKEQLIYIKPPKPFEQTGISHRFSTNFGAAAGMPFFPFTWVQNHLAYSGSFGSQDKASEIMGETAREQVNTISRS